MSSFIFGSAKTPLLDQEFLERDELCLDLAFFQFAGLRDQFGQLGDFLAQVRRDRHRRDHILKLRNDFLLLFVRQVVEIVGQPLVHLLSAIAFRVLEDSLALVPHALQAAPHGVEAGGEASLEHRHRESQARGHARNRPHAALMD